MRIVVIDVYNDDIFGNFPKFLFIFQFKSIFKYSLNVNCLSGTIANCFDTRLDTWSYYKISM